HLGSLGHLEADGRWLDGVVQRAGHLRGRVSLVSVRGLELAGTRLDFERVDDAAVVEGEPASEVGLGQTAAPVEDQLVAPAGGAVDGEVALRGASLPDGEPRGHPRLEETLATEPLLESADPVANQRLPIAVAGAERQRPGNDRGGKSERPLDTDVVEARR